MPSLARRLLPALAAAGLCCAGSSAGAQGPAKPAASTPPAPAPAMFSAPEYVMGNPRAKVTVIEYASASCPHCARFDINVFPAFKARYIDKGKIRYVFREFLTPPEQLAAAGFLLARCAGHDRYWTVVEAVFRAQAEIYATQNIRGPFQRIAHSVGLTDAEVDACLSDKPAIDALNARVGDAVNRQHIDGTPTFVINGVKAFSGEVELQKLDAAVDTALAGRRVRPIAPPLAKPDA